MSDFAADIATLADIGLTSGEAAALNRVLARLSAAEAALRTEMELGEQWRKERLAADAEAARLREALAPVVKYVETHYFVNEIHDGDEQLVVMLWPSEIHAARAALARMSTQGADA